MIKNQWYAIYPSKKIKKGQVLSLRRLSLDLVLFRNQKGQLGAVMDRCSHRGAALSKGKVKGDCLQCPFHGLEFSIHGQTQFIPALGKANQKGLTRFNLQHFAVREAHDIIFLWYGDGQPSENLPFFSDIDDSFTYSEIADHWKAHYSRAIENQLDVIHLPFVHHNTIGRGHKTLVNGPKVIFEDETLLTSANNEKDQGQTPLKPEASEIRSTHLKFRFPNLWQNHISDKIRVLIYFAPVDEVNTILYLRFYSKATKVKALNQLMAQAGKLGNLIVERQDRRIVITQQPKASSLKSGENLLQGDGPIIMYRKLRHQLKEAANQPSN